MDPAEFAETAQYWLEIVLIWVGFGTLSGLAGKAIMPGRDPGGAVATLMIGIGGTVIGCGVLTYFYQGQRVTPISPLGFVAATVGAFIILFFYRILSGYWFIEGDDMTRRRSRRRSRRRMVEAGYEE